MYMIMLNYRKDFRHILTMLTAMDAFACGKERWPAGGLSSWYSNNYFSFLVLLDSMGYTSSCFYRACPYKLDLIWL